MQDHNPEGREPDRTELLDKWERHRSQTGEELSPEQLCPDCTADLRRALREDIENLKTFFKMFVDGPDESVKPFEPVQFTTDVYSGIEIVGEGGQGKVLRAKDTHLDRDVAVKILKTRWRWNGAAQNRLEREARITGKLEHPGVLPVYGFGRDQDGQSYYAMRYLRDEYTFDMAIGRLFEITDPSSRSVEFRKMLNQFSTICRTIDYAHHQGIIHRDIKPDNIMTGNFGEVFVADWGLAKSSSGEIVPVDSEDSPSGAGLSFVNTSGIAGTLGYMSPEQAEGSDKVGVQSDLFSLGATLYHLLTGKAPFQGDSVSELLRQVKTGRFTSPRNVRPTIPKALEAICLKAMSQQPTDRYASAGALADEIDRWLADEPVDAWPDPFFEQLRRWVKRHRILVTSSFAVLFVASSLLAVGTVLLESARRAEQTANQELAVAYNHLEEQNTKLRRPQYASQIQLVQSLYNDGELSEADRVLDSTDEDIRGSEWYFWKNACRQPDEISVQSSGDSVDSLGRPSVIQGVISNNGNFIAAVVRNVSILHNGFTWTIRVYDVHSRSILWEHKTKNFVRSLSFSPDDNKLVVETEITPAVAEIPLGDALKNLHNQQKTRDQAQSQQQTPETKTSLLMLQTADGKKLDTAGEVSSRQRSLSFSVEVTDPSAPVADYTFNNQNPPGFKNQLVKFEEQHADNTNSLPSLTLNLPEGIRITAAALDTSRTLAGTALSDGTIRVWRVSVPVPVAVFPTLCAEVTEIAFGTQDDPTLVWTGNVLAATDKRFFTIDVPNLANTEIPEGWRDAAEVIASIADDSRELLRGNNPAPVYHAKMATGVARSGNGDCVAYITRAGKLCVWSLSENNFLLQQSLWASDALQLAPHLDDAQIALNHDSSLVAVVIRSPGNRPTLSVFDVPHGKQLWSSDEFEAPLCFAGDDLLATGSGSQSVVKLNAKTGQVEQELSLWGENPPIAKLGVLTHNPGQNLLIGFPEVHKSMLRQMKGDSLIFPLQLGGVETRLDSVRTPSPGSTREVSQVRYSRDGTKGIIAHKNDSRVEVWDIRNWRIQSLLDGHQGPVTAIAFSSDETRIATASLDSTIRIWDVQAGSSLATLHGTDIDPQGYWFVTFDDDDSGIIAFSHRGIHRWNP